MRSDALLAFVPLGSPLTISGTGSAIPSPTVIDLLGEGVGQAPANIIGNVSLFGAPDAMGIGAIRPELNIVVGTAFVTGNSATLNVALQGAPDTAVTFQPGTWQTLVESGTLTAAQLLAGTVIFRCPWLPPFPANLRPRYLRLLFTTLAATAFTAGTIGSAIVTLVRDDQANRYGANNYVVS